MIFPKSRSHPSSAPRKNDAPCRTRRLLGCRSSAPYAARRAMRQVWAGLESNWPIGKGLGLQLITCHRNPRPILFAKRDSTLLPETRAKTGLFGTDDQPERHVLLKWRSHRKRRPHAPLCRSPLNPLPCKLATPVRDFLLEIMMMMTRTACGTQPSYPSVRPNRTVPRSFQRLDLHGPSQGVGPH